MKVLAIIPARGGSKRIPNKNIRDFCGKPLIVYAIEQACAVPFVSRVIVDTDSEEIAKIAKKYGAEVPFLRPRELATDTAQVADSLLHLLSRLKKEQEYEPTHVLILQTTSPLREQRDIQACFDMMRKTDATTVLTVAPTHPRLYHLDAENRLILANKEVTGSTNVQAWTRAYLLNGCFVYLVKVPAFLKERKILCEDTRGVICDRWRSIDLDEEEDWVVAEHLFRHRREIEENLKQEFLPLAGARPKPTMQ
ncbi:MAG: acylneuraminate cytidylyltransferase family protein [Parcubacteria group bacterium]|nr:acylneuraminate cytidylyltransferase family protein [Parcubacteria group bacterium]